ncbi:MAG: polynucleotide kinase-phosphatase [Azovibrio sp.]
MKLKIPELSLVVLIGASGSGKSSFARQHFLPTEIVSSDTCRGLVADDENDQNASKEAFELLHYLITKRLQRGRLTVVDATNVKADSRKALLAIAREYHFLPIAIVLDMPEQLCRERNAQRVDRNFGIHVIRNQRAQLQRSIRGLAKEGFRYLYIFKNEDEANAAKIMREPLWNNRRNETGPFDIIGDVHGCFEELQALLDKLGYSVGSKVDNYPLQHPQGRRLVFVGDLVDRGPATPDVLRLVMRAVADGMAFCVAGNHDSKLSRALSGKKVTISYGLELSLQQLAAESEEFRQQVQSFTDALISHYVFDNGRLVVAHAGLKESMQGRGSGAVRSFALYGETTGEVDEFGLPVRYPWAKDYRGQAMVVYGHTPVPQTEWLNNTICLDTGCVFGGKLTALRYPEKELVSIPAAQVYFEPVRPLQAAVDGRIAQHEVDDVLDLADITTRRMIHTRLRHNVTIHAEHSAAALEVMSRFAADPHWLVYLPPTMSPCETSERETYLEYPTEAFSYYRSQGIDRVVCEEKHMGSRAVVVICRDAEAAKQRFGVTDNSNGLVYTRTGRPFFTDEALHTAFLERLRTAITKADLWNEFATEWFVFDCELMPWSAKAMQLIRQQYAGTGVAAKAMLAAANTLLDQAGQNGLDVAELQAHFTEREQMAQDYIAAYRRYCWQVDSIEDYRLAPFHLLAAEGHVFSDKDHEWQMQTLHRLCAADPNWLLATPFHVVDLNNDSEVMQACEWWETLTAKGGEGMVVKPFDFIARGDRGLVQPAIKCRGREYLRIIYGPEYTLPKHLKVLRQRGLGSKRGLAMREFALGIEGLERFVARQPLRHVHECTFGVLALESEPVDPRL